MNLSLCPKEDFLLEFAAATLKPEDVGLVNAHLDGCEHCSALLADPEFNRKASVAPKKTVGEYPCLPGYTITGVIDRGGCGVVYQARNKDGIGVAIKRLTECNELSRKRFNREVEILQRLDHPNVIPMIHPLYFHDEVFQILPLANGGTLKQKEKPMATAEAVRIVATIAHALEYCHGQGVVHRDVKPANILFFDAGEFSKPVICDFGVAAAAESAPLTQAGDQPGTYVYMSPEQIGALYYDISYPTDIYSLGVVLYELLSGRRPYTGKTVAEIQSQINKPRRLREAAPTIDSALEAIVMKSLAISPKDRYSSMFEFAEALENYSQTQNDADQSHLIRARVDRRFRNKVVAAAVLLATVAVSLLFATGYFAPNRNAVDSVKSPPTSASRPIDQEGAASKTELANTRTFVQEIGGTTIDTVFSDGSPGIEILIGEGSNIERLTELLQHKGIRFLQVTTPAPIDFFSQLDHLTKLERLTIAEQRDAPALFKALRLAPSVNHLCSTQPGINREQIQTIASIRTITTVTFSSNPIPESDLLAGFEGADHLKSIDINYCPLTDKHLASMPYLPNLDSLLLNKTVITDEGLKSLRLPALRSLILDDTDITDASIETVRQFRNLEMLGILGTKVSDRGVAKLRNYFPNLHVRH